MATYNGETFVGQQIASILSQLGPLDELLISDDGSTDRTLDIICDIKDPRIQIRTEGRIGIPMFNLERALCRASGDFIFLSDQDDIWAPDKVEHCLTALQACDLVTTDCELMDGAGNPLGRRLSELRTITTGFWPNLWKNRFVGCCMAFRRNILLASLPFPSSISTHDLWIGLIAALHGKSRYLALPLVLHRRHGGNYSYEINRSGKSRSAQLLDRLAMLRNVLFRLVKLRLQRL